MAEDTISRQAAIDRFENLSYDDWNQGVSTTWANAFAECAEIIRELPTAEPQWIPCSERLPEPGEYYLVTRQFFWGYREIDIARYDFDGWKADTVLAWCELPNPYKGETNG